MQVGLLSREANYYPAAAAAARAWALRSPEGGCRAAENSALLRSFPPAGGGAQRLMGLGFVPDIDESLQSGRGAIQIAFFFGGQGLLLMGRERFPNVGEVQIAGKHSW